MPLMSVAPVPDELLISVLERSRALGFLGPGPVEPHVAHARRFEAPLPLSGRVLDLGSGGGVPGLVIAHDRTDLRVVLLDARQGRVDALIRGIGRLGLAGRCSAVCGQAEAIARKPDFGDAFDAVVARLFGPLPETVAVGLPFVKVGGLVVVSVAVGSEAPVPLPQSQLFSLVNQPDPGVVVVRRNP
jgi:16S rRNA (guanine527-N7)-methyltransferase